MILGFPEPGDLVRQAYRELWLAVNGTPEQQKALGNHASLPRPWDPASCAEPDLRLQVWEWLEQVVIWLNREYSWDVATLIPTCWPLHPHVVHEVAVVADQRRRGGLALTSEALEEWHRYCLPGFVDRMRSRVRSHCDDEHTSWPSRPRHSEHVADGSRERREDMFALDVDALTARQAAQQSRASSTPPRLGLVDLETGLILEDHDGDKDRT